jgi:uncharacterized protein YgiM (DUF1202 family)
MREETKMKRNIIFLMAALVIIAVFGVVYPAAAQTGNWTAEYFANANLAGSPAIIQSETSPAHNWGTGSPAPTIPADYFSARWTSVQYLNAGTYQVTVRADDGVQVFVDGIAYINEWHGAANQTYTASFNLVAGQHIFVVQFFENQGAAFIEYTLSGVVPPTATPVPQPTTPPNTAALATINTNQLNVRSAPNLGGVVLTRVFAGQVYTVTGRLADNSWIQINVNGLVGWVNAGYVYAVNLQLAPIINNPSPIPATPVPTQVAPPSGGTGTATINTSYLNLRDVPNASIGRVLRQLRLGEVYTVIGRNNDTSWLQIDANGVRGWINASFVSASNLQNVPVTVNSVRPTTGTATITAGRLNVRNAPSITGSVLTRVTRGDTYQIVGRNSDASWIQINVSGVTVGWINRGYVSLAPGTNVFNFPVTG